MLSLSDALSSSFSYYLLFLTTICSCEALLFRLLSRGASSCTIFPFPLLLLETHHCLANAATMAAQGLDAQTLYAVIKLQLDELKLLGRSSKGKGREGEAPADFELVLELYKAEMASCALVSADSSMCRSIARAVLLDCRDIDEAAHEELQSSMLDNALFPPRCCRKPIPLDPNRKFLAAELAGQFQAKKIEFKTKHRTYCHRPECLTFVPPKFIHGEVATCVSCQRRTCTICKDASHTGDCPRDESVQEVLQLAQANGWQRCYSCRCVVELDHGCNHMRTFATSDRKAEADLAMHELQQKGQFAKFTDFITKFTNNADILGYNNASRVRELRTKVSNDIKTGLKYQINSLEDDDFDG